jgi:hypothetical protein
MKRFTSVVLLNLVFVISIFAQEREKTPIGGRPDIKGDLFLELGFNTLNNKPSELNTEFFQSRTFNIYYQYPVKIFGDKSGFTFNPGIGVASDKFAFQGGKNLFNNPSVGPNSSQLLGVTEVYGDDITVNKNNVGINILEIPLEFRYHFNKNNYDKSVRFAFGGKVGYLFQAQTKISYTDNGLERKIKDRQSFGFNQFRYGVHARLGFPGFNLWGYYGLNEVFQKDKGPFNTQATQLNFGVSIALF